MGDEAVDPLHDLASELGRLAVELLERLGEAVSDPHVLPAKLSKKLHLVVAGDTEQRVVGPRHLTVRLNG